jgi:hypothetical protein
VKHYVALGGGLNWPGKVEWVFVIAVLNPRVDIKVFPLLLSQNEWSARSKTHPTLHVKRMNFLEIYVLKFDKTR